MRKRTLIYVGSLLIIEIALVAANALSRPASALPITVSFLSYTNDTNGLRFATFAVTNHSTATIRRLGIYCPEIQQQPGLRPTLHLGANVFLVPGQSEVIAVSPPTNSGAWRVTLHCYRDGWRRRFSDWCPQGSGGLIDAVVLDRLRGVPSQRVQSDWIDQ